MMREIDHLRQEVDIARGSPVYGQQSQGSVMPTLLQPPVPGPSQLPLPRLSAQNVYPSLTPSPLPNGAHSSP